MQLLREGVRAVSKFEVDGLAYRDKEIWICQTKRGVGRGDTPVSRLFMSRTTTAKRNVIVCSTEVL